MNVYRISKCDYINDLSGFGAAHFPGRWNSEGVYILYTAATASLALLETVVHFGRIVSGDYCMLTLDIPETAVLEIGREKLPADWFQNPAPDRLKAIGDAFIEDGQLLALKLPSAVMQEDYNYLINPQHKDFNKIIRTDLRRISIDKRLIGQA